MSRRQFSALVSTFPNARFAFVFHVSILHFTLTPPRANAQDQLIKQFQHPRIASALSRGLRNRGSIKRTSYARD